MWREESLNDVQLSVLHVCKQRINTYERKVPSEEGIQTSQKMPLCLSCGITEVPALCSCVDSSLQCSVPVRFAGRLQVPKCFPQVDRRALQVPLWGAALDGVFVDSGNVHRSSIVLGKGHQVPVTQSLAQNSSPE